MTTRRPHTMDAEALAAVVFEGASDPILVLGTDGTVLEANEHAVAVFGDDVVGREFGIPTSPGKVSEIELHTADGLRVSELRTGRAEVDGEPVFVATLRDITDRKRVEQSLRDFVSTASHEFRTPLFAIQGFAETLELQWEHLADEDRRTYVSTIHRQAQRLARLTDDLLTVTRLDGEAMAPAAQPTLCGVVAERAAALLSIEVELDVAADLRAHVDPDHLEDVLVNLLTNAEKYGEAPFLVSGSVDGDAVVLRVVDHGEGVPAEFRERMFERFSRERRAARDHPGTGLGLSIAQGLLRRNGGELGYEVTPGGGATFVVRLPVAQL